MTRESKKAQLEREVFISFLERTGIGIVKDSIRGGVANRKEPDIVCTSFNGSEIGFELSRLTDPILASVRNRREPQNGEYVRLGGYDRKALSRKLRKIYSVYPVELLLYRESIGTPDNILISQVRIQCRCQHRYRKVWYISKSVVKTLYERS
jgi:hypothetical protein